MREIQEAQGIKIKTLEDEPVLSSHLQWVWKAFTDLNYRRSAGFGGPLPITYSDIDSYCRLKGIDLLVEREKLLRFIDALDRAYMADTYEKQKVEDARNSGATPPPPPSQSPPRHGRTQRKPRQQF